MRAPPVRTLVTVGHFKSTEADEHTYSDDARPHACRLRTGPPVSLNTKPSSPLSWCCCLVYLNSVASSEELGALQYVSVVGDLVLLGALGGWLTRAAIYLNNIQTISKTKVNTNALAS